LPEELNELILSFLDVDDRNTLAADLHIRRSQYFLTWEKLLDSIIKDAIEPEVEGATPPSWKSFTKIHTVKLSDHGAQRPDVRDLCVLLALPALRTLETDSLAASPDMHLGMETRGPSTVRRLAIRGCRAKADVLTGLFRLTPQLRELSIEWSSRHNNYWRTDWRRIGRALTKLTPALEHLEFTHPIDENFDVGMRESQGLASNDDLEATLAPLGSLKSLKSLRTLTLSTLALFGQNQAQDWPELETLLPQSIEKLEQKVLAKDIYLVGNDRLIATEPYVSRTQSFVIYNCQKDRWISKDGEGALPPKPPRRTETVARFDEAMLRQVITLPPGHREMAIEQMLQMTSHHHGHQVATQLAQVLNDMMDE
ncbi:hypothetical protein HII31_10832, partial [Pseudocercospora fuligena]